MKIYKITWLDSSGDSRQMSLEEAKEIRPVVIETIGFVIQEADDFITIAQDILNYPKAKDIRCPICIPDSAIIEIEEYENDPIEP